MQASLATYAKKFARLKRSSVNGGAPHKPILLLAVLHEAMQGRVEKGRVYISPELIAAFRSYWNQLVHTQHDCLMALPFFHMHTEGFWTLVQKPGELRLDAIKQFTKSLVRLDAAVEYAQLTPDLALLIVDNEANALLRTTLLETYFPQARKGPDPVPYGQQEIFDNI